MPRGNPSGVRSGRINTPPATDSIIVTEKETTYRFSNTGKTLFSVKYTGDSGPVTIDVKERCSIDVKVPEDVTVAVVGSPATGVFDLLQTGKPARGGKFRGSVPIVIAKRRKGEIYRVFNGGDVSFQTVPPAIAPLENIPIKSSRDVLVSAGEFKIAVATGKVAGAFDAVDSADIRSGRFVYTSGAAGATRDYLIVDLSGDTVAEQTYRITNTGEEPFKVVLGATAATERVLAELAFDQSIDVQFAGGSDSLLKIRALGDAKTVTGIYDNI